jgi:SAM-dependent methyltransferase
MVTTDQATNRQAYVFNNADHEAANQLRVLAEILDTHSISILSEVGVGSGQQWLDAGAGLGTISQFLSTAVGPDGRVTALDIDPRHIQPGPNIRVVADDIRDATFTSGSFDGVHVRLLTMHLADPGKILAMLADALRPDGVLVVSEWDCEWRDLVRASPGRQATRLVDRFMDVSLGIGQRAGIDLGWAKRVHAAMTDLGLVEVRTVTESRSWRGGTGICLLHRSNSIARAELLLRAGFTGVELQRFRALMLDPRLVLSGYLMHTTVGRKRGQRPGPATPETDNAAASAGRTPATSDDPPGTGW